MDIPLLKDIVIIFGLSLFVLLICNRLHIPVIVGFLVTGILVGPHGLSFINGIGDVENLAQIGIIMLLFTIGLEFSRKKLLEMKHFFFVGGTLQFILTTLIGFLVATSLRRPMGEALFLGFLLSMSSTAIVLKAFEAKDETDTLYGRLSLGILIFQDIIAVPLMIITPILGPESHTMDTHFLVLLMKGCLILLVTMVIAIKIIPWTMYYIAKTRSHELFLLSILTVCFSVAWLTSSFGLSLSLGAFLAGLIISESEYSRAAMSEMIPLRDIFSSFFFVSMGMLLDMNFVLAQPLLIVFLALCILLMKGSIVSLIAYFCGMPIRVMVMAGIALSQIGEFSFVLVRAGIENHLATDYLFQLFLSVALLTMMLTPPLIGYSQQIAHWIQRLPLPEWLKNRNQCKHQIIPKMQHKDHVVIIGFGISGRNLASAAKDAGIPYNVVEMNPETVRKEKKKGEPIIFGDATREDVLHHLNIQEAKSVVVVINDATATKRIIEVVRKLNPNSYVIVRTRYVRDMKTLFLLGADEVIPDEFGSSIEILMRILQEHQVPKSTIDTLATDLRKEGYELLREI